MIKAWEELKNEKDDNSNPGKYIEKKTNPIEALLHPKRTKKETTVNKIKRLLNPKPRI
ncbi:MAG: hypothetical protein GY710_06225 [Desulfobacteraceae bacterium]|nr:hypothetical protein [Desulfobacteraceae bacterium]